jgi:hypothetical protein
LAAGTFYDQFGAGGYWSGVLWALFGLATLITLMGAPKQSPAPKP